MEDSMSTPGTHETVGQRLKALRLQKGWTLEMIARKIGSHKGYVSGIENHKVNPPSARILQKIARAFRMDEAATKLLLKLSEAEKSPKIIRDEMVDLVLNHNGHCGKVAVPEPAKSELAAAAV
jgi:transcriptional regulator with XRE-family HTH domain